MVDLRGTTPNQKILAWGIKNPYKVAVYVIISVFIYAYIFIMLAIIGYNSCTLALVILLFFVPVLLFVLYQLGMKYHEVIKILDSDIISMKFVLIDTLKITSKKYGEFYLDYSSGGERGKGFYRVWIVLDKQLESKQDEMILWERKSSSRKTPRSHNAVPVRSAIQIRTLRRLTLEKKGNNQIIMALLDDEAGYSEAEDILESVGILEHIWAKL